MKYIVILFALLTCNSSQNTQLDTTYYLIRHADKDRNSNSQNPHLNEKGKLLAKKWVTLLEDKGISMIYSTNYNRTLETAEPLAQHLDLDIKTYVPNNAFTSTLKEEANGKTVLVVGHSNTIPYLVNDLINEKRFTDLDDLNNGALFKVNLYKDGSFNIQVTQHEEGF